VLHLFYEKLRGRLGVTIQNLRITNGDAAFGGGISYVDDLIDVTLVNSIVSGNHATEGGGGIAMSGNDQTLTLVNSIVFNNSTSGGLAPMGGGIELGEATEQATLLGSKVLNNTAPRGGGIATDAEDTGLTLIGSTLSGNTGSAGGGGIYDHSGPAGTGIDISGSTLSGNHATNDDGGAIDLDAPLANVTLTNTTVGSNTAGNEGGGIAVESRNATLTLTNSTVEGNTAGLNAAVGGNGGGISEDGGADNAITLTGSRVRFNTALESNPAGSGGQGGGIFFQACSTTNTLFLDHSIVRTNLAQTDGGIYNEGFQSICSGGNAGVVASNSQITRNLALRNGGGIFNIGVGSTDATVVLIHSAVGAIPGLGGTGNGAMRGGGIYNDGSLGGGTGVGLHASSAVVANVATVDGGGIFNNAGVILPDPDTTFADNVPNNCVAC
jgi:hypothetical protein